MTPRTPKLVKISRVRIRRDPKRSIQISSRKGGSVFWDVTHGKPLRYKVVLIEAYQETAHICLNYREMACESPNSPLSQPRRYSRSRWNLPITNISEPSQKHWIHFCPIQLRVPIVIVCTEVWFRFQRYKGLLCLMQRLSNISVL